MTQKTPAHFSLLSPEAPIILSLTFNRPVEESSLPPNSSEWKLVTPIGNVDSENLERHGKFTYFPFPSEFQGFSIPPNTLLMEWNTPLEPNELHSFELFLAPEPTNKAPGPPDKIPNQISWEFELAKADPPPVAGTGFLSIKPMEPEPEEHFELKDFTVCRAAVVGSHLRVQISGSPLPRTRPFTEKTLVLEIPWDEEDPEGRNLNDYISQVEYTETDFEVDNRARPSSSLLSRQWVGQSGKLALRRVGKQKLVFEVDLLMKARSEEQRDVSIQGSFEIVR